MRYRRPENSWQPWLFQCTLYIWKRSDSQWIDNRAPVHMKKETLDHTSPHGKKITLPMDARFSHPMSDVSPSMVMILTTQCQTKLRFCFHVWIKKEKAFLYVHPPPTPNNRGFNQWWKRVGSMGLALTQDSSDNGPGHRTRTPINMYIIYLI